MSRSKNSSSQKQLKVHKKAMSISSNAVANNINMPGSMTSKKASIRKIKGDIQKTLIKGYITNKGDSDSNGAMLELSTRTPDKTNPELSPYMMDFYKKKRSMYDDGITNKLRASGSHLKGLNKANNTSRKEKSRSPSCHNISSRHKKSKSQTSIHGLKSMDNRQSNLTEGQTNEFDKVLGKVIKNSNKK